MYDGPTSRLLLVALSLIVVVSGCIGNPKPSDTGPSTSVVDSPSTRLEIQSNANANITITLKNVNSETNETVFQRDYPPKYGTINLSDEFQNRVPYHAKISVDGSVVWNRTIYGAEGYRLTIEKDGTVVVRDHVEV